MIPFVDVAMVGFVHNLFVNDPAGRNPNVYWGPPEASRQSLAIGEGQADAGVMPAGVSVFRTGCNEDKARYNQPKAATIGLPIGINTDHKSYNRILDIPVIAEYTCCGWSAALSDVNDIEREMWFSTRYKVLRATIQGNDFHWYISVQSPGYKQMIQEQSGKIVWYEVYQKYLVAAEWIHSTNIPLVQTIDVAFYDLVTSGNAIPGNLINQIQIGPIT